MWISPFPLHISSCTHACTYMHTHARTHTHKQTKTTPIITTEFILVSKTKATRSCNTEAENNLKLTSSPLQSHHFILLPRTISLLQEHKENTVQEQKCASTKTKLKATSTPCVKNHHTILMYILECFTLTLISQM